MASEPTYNAARAVAVTLEEYFEKSYHQATEDGGLHVAALPDRQVIEEMINTAFWASLQREEGAFPKISLAYVPPSKSELPLLFGKSLPFWSSVLNKMAPAVERPGIHLGIWPEDGNLRIWGTTRTIPGGGFVLEVVEPGLLVVKYRRLQGIGKFMNVAVLQGDQVKIIDELKLKHPGTPDLILSLLGFQSPTLSGKAVNVLIQLAVSMRAHGRGGALLVVPAGTEKWKESIIHPIKYEIAPLFSGISDLMKQAPETRNAPWLNKLNQAVESIAGLTAVDGATIINDRYEVLAFGAKIGRSEGKPGVHKLLVTEPVMGNHPSTVHPSQHGGTRHLSAAQFAQDQPDAFALVASQDRRFTVFKWSEEEQVVQSYRIDALLL